MRRLMFAAIGILFGTAAMADTVPLDQLLAGATVTAGDKTFSNFGYVGSPGSTPSSDISVSTLPPSGLSGPPGIEFSGPFGLLPGQTRADVLLSYAVTSSDGPITAVNLTGNPLAIGAGNLAMVVETVFSTADLVHPLGQIYISYQDGVSRLSDTLNLGAGQGSLFIKKDIEFLGHSTGGFATLSFVDQTFTQAVPEPSSMLMCSLAGVIVSGFYARRRAVLSKKNS